MVVFVLPGCGSACTDVVIETHLLVGYFLRERSHELLKESWIFLIKREIDALIVASAGKGVVFLRGKRDTCSWVRAASSSLKMP
jgi:hypothetical protein